MGYRYGVGLKRSGSEILDELSLIVYVSKKLPVAELPPEQRVPSEHEDFRTDVVQARFTRLADSAPYDPLLAGIEISPSAVQTSRGALRIERGTIGCVMRRRTDGKRLLLTCAHVASHNDDHDVDLHDWIGQSIYHPADSEPNAIVIGSCVEADDDLDAALIEPNGSRSLINVIRDIGPQRGSGTVNLWDPVRKRGRTTGLTNAVVVAFLSDAAGNPRTIEFVGSPPAQIVDHGDSGSALVNSRQEVVGLVSAMNDESGMNGLATLIAPIRDRFQADVVTMPAIALIEPASAVVTALGTVTIEGVGFDPPAQVFFGDTPAPVLGQTATRLDVLPPPRLVATTVDVTVTNRWGDSSDPAPTSRFQYLAIA